MDVDNYRAKKNTFTTLGNTFEKTKN